MYWPYDDNRYATAASGEVAGWPQRRAPQTNGMVERFNGRISDVLQSHHFVNGEDLAQTLYRYVLLYNQQLPQSTLGSKTPLDAMQRWYESHPHLFVKRPCNLAGSDAHASVRIDSDVMAWLKSQGKGYQTRLNAILREAMVRDHPKA